MLEDICLPPPPIFHSTPVAPHCVSTDSLGIQSFDMNRGSLPPDHGSLNLEMFAPLTGTVTPFSVNQFVSSSGPPVTMQPITALTTSGLSKERVEEIFLLAHKVRALGRKLACEFAQLSQQEALLCMGVESTSYKRGTWGWPDCITEYYSMLKSEGQGASAKEVEEAIDCLRAEVGKAWLETNSILYHHALNYQEKMTEFMAESSQVTEALHDCIWDVVMKIMEDAGKSAADGLGITLHLVDMLPTIPLQLTFNTAMPGLTSFAPDVYAALPKSRMDLLDFSYVQPPKSEWNVMSVLHEEVVKNVCGTTEEKAVPPTWLLSVAPVSSISVKAVEAGGGNGPTSSPHVPGSPAAQASRSPTLHTSQSPTLHTSQSLVPHIPSKSPSLGHRS